MSIVRLTFQDFDTQADTRRDFFAGIEATAEQEAGPDAGRVLGTGHRQVVSPGHDGQVLRAVGDDTYCYLRASLDGEDGPWTDLSAGSLLAEATEDEVIDIWYQAVARRWDSAVPVVRPEFSLRLSAVRAVGWLV